MSITSADPNAQLLTDYGTVAARALDAAGSPIKLDLQEIVAAELLSKPLGLGRNASGSPCDLIQVSGAFVGDDITGGEDLVLNAYSVPFIDGALDFNQRNHDPISSTTLDSSTGTIIGSDLLTNGAYAAIVAGADSVTAVGDNTVALPAATDLSAVVAGDWLRIAGRTDGAGGYLGNSFLITAVSDGDDEVEVTPAPNTLVTDADWSIHQSWDGLGTGWTINLTTADYSPEFQALAGEGAISQVDPSLLAGWALLRCESSHFQTTGTVNFFIGTTLLAKFNALTSLTNMRKLIYHESAPAGLFKVEVKGGASYRMNDASLHNVTPYFFSKLFKAEDYGAGICFGFTPSGTMASDSFLTARYQRFRL